MATSHAPKHEQSRQRRKEADHRVWSNWLNMWRVCATTACRRARSCRGNPSDCFRDNFKLLPDGVRELFRQYSEALRDGIPSEVAWDELRKDGLVAEFADWQHLAHGKRA